MSAVKVQGSKVVLANQYIFKPTLPQHSLVVDLTLLTEPLDHELNDT